MGRTVNAGATCPAKGASSTRYPPACKVSDAPACVSAATVFLEWATAHARGTAYRMMAGWWWSGEASTTAARSGGSQRGTPAALIGWTAPPRRPDQDPAVTNLFGAIGEHRDDPTRLLLLGADGQYYDYPLPDGPASRVEPGEDWVVDETAPDAEELSD